MANPVAAADRPSTTVESEPKESASTQVSVNSRSPQSYQGRHLYGDTVSYAAARIEAVTPLMSTVNRVCILLGVLLLSWVYGMDYKLRRSYLIQASKTMAGHPHLVTLSVIRILCTIISPAAAKLSDIFGRLEMLLVTLAFTIGGTMITAAASKTDTVVVGNTFYEIGYNMAALILHVIVTDVTSLRCRLLFIYIPDVPHLVNFWTKPPLERLIIAKLSWHAGVWLWCAVYPICAMPLVYSMWQLRRKTKIAGLHQDYKQPLQERGVLELAKSLFWELDAIGNLIFLIGFGLFLSPFAVKLSEYDGALNWKSKLFAPMVIGALILPVWVLYERRAPYPMAPVYILRDRAAWGSFGVTFFGLFAWALEGPFLYPVLRIAFDLNDYESKVISSIYDYNMTVSGIIVGAIVYRLRRLKWFILTGTFISLVSYALMIYFQGELGTQNGVVASQLLMGIAGGFFILPALVSLQACVKHEHVAVITGLSYTISTMGNACGTIVVAALANYLVSKEIYKELGEAGRTWAKQPFLELPQHPVGDTERDAVNLIYKRFQRIRCIVGGVITIAVGIFAFCVRNPRLPDSQSLPYDVIHRPRENRNYDEEE